jgi:hypothetical protein
VGRYKDYAALPAHVKEMLVAVTSDDAAAERYAHAPNRNLRGQSVFALMNVPFGQRLVERFLYDLGNYLGVDGMDRFPPRFGSRE